METFKRLYLLTGKGGVGKTTLAIGFCKYLQSRGQSPVYFNFNSGSLDEKIDISSNQYISKTLDKLNLDYEFLKLEKTVQDYVSDKLNSSTIGFWVVKAPFFRSLINIIPGLNYVIYIGKIINYLDKNPEKIAILDGPASGHSLTLLNSIYRFKDIFSSGVLHEDCVKICNKLEDDNYFKILLATLPQSLVLSEAKDYIEELKDLHQYPLGLIINQSINELKIDIKSSFLKRYAEREVEALDKINFDSENIKIPFFSENKLEVLCNKVSELNLGTLA